VGLFMCTMKTNIFRDGCKASIQHCGMSSFPHYEHNKEGESPWSLKVGHRCNVTSQRPMNGGGPTWCTSHHGGKMCEAKRIKRMTR